MNDIGPFLDRHFAKPMFILSLVFLFYLAGVLHFEYVDVDHKQKTGVSGAISKMGKSAKKFAAKRRNKIEAEEEVMTAETDTVVDMNEFWARVTSNGQQYHPSEIMKSMCLRGILLLYPIFILELMYMIWKRSPRWKRYLLYCLVPPFRLAGRDHTSGKSIWLPKTGWAEITPDLKDRVEKGFTIPMIVIALLVVPLLGLEFVYKDKINATPSLTLLVQMAAGLIWLAFTYEFIVLISIVEKRKEYCKKHWVDIAVILLPLIAFMRLGRLGRLGRLSRLQKTARLYRIRGMLMRTYRAILLYNVIDRYILRKSPGKMLIDLRQKCMDKEEELNEMRERIQELEGELALTSIDPEPEVETETESKISAA